MESCRSIMGSFGQHGFCLFCSQSVQEERKHEEILALKKNKKTQRRLQEFSWLYWWRKLQIPKGLAPGVIITKKCVANASEGEGKRWNIYLARLWDWMWAVGKRYTSPFQLTSGWTGLLCLNAKWMFTGQNNSIYGKERTMNISLALKCLLNDGALL